MGLFNDAAARIAGAPPPAPPAAPEYVLPGQSVLPANLQAPAPAGPPPWAGAFKPPIKTVPQEAPKAGPPAPPWADPTKPRDNPLGTGTPADPYYSTGIADSAYAHGTGSVPYEGKAAPPPGGGGGGGGISVVPAHWEPHSRATTTQGGVQFSPGTRKALDEAEGHARAGIQLQADAEKEQLAQRQRLAEIEAQQAMADQASEKLRAYRQQAALEDQEKHINTLVDDVKQDRIDPEHFFASRTTGQKIAIAISLALGGFVAGATGRTNDAMTKFNADIDRDIHAQVQNFNAKRANIGEARTAYAMARQRFGDEAQSQIAARLMAKEQLQIRLKAAETGTQDKLQQARAQQLLAANEREIAQLRGKFDEMASARVATSSQEVYKPAAMVGGGSGGGEGLTLGGVDRSMYVDLGDGTGIMARSKEEGEKLRDAQGRSQQVVGIIGQLKTMDANASVIDKANPLSTYNRSRSALIAQAQQDLTVLQGQGAMSKGDQEVANQALGGAHRFTNNGPIYDAAARTVQQGVINRLTTQSGGRVKEIRVQKGQHVTQQYVPIPGGPPGAPGAGAPTPGFKPNTSR